MDRIIKFRAWNKKTKSWEHKDGCDILGEMILLGGWMHALSIKDLNEIEVMQYTGIKDKNGKSIYEGDVVTCGLWHKGSTLPHMGTVIYDNEHCSFATENLGGVTLFHNLDLKSMSIIGNTFENHELLKKLK